MHTLAINFRPSNMIRDRDEPSSSDSNPRRPSHVRRYDQCLFALWLWSFIFGISTTLVFVLLSKKGPSYKIIGIILLVITLLLFSMAYSMCRSKSRQTASIEDSATMHRRESISTNTTSASIYEEWYVQQDLPPPYYVCVKLPSYFEVVKTTNNQTNVQQV